MKLIPLILSTADVKAIFENRKTRHTVPVKPQPIDNTLVDGNFFHGNHKGYVKVDGHPNWQQQFAIGFGPFGSPGDSEWQTGRPPEDGMYWVDGQDGPLQLTPHKKNAVSVYQIGASSAVCVPSCVLKWKRMGSIMYCREAWRLRGWDFEEGTMLIEYATGEKKNCRVYDPTEDSGWLMNQVEMLESKGYIIATSSERFEFTDKQQPFNSPVTMPREASRIWLEVTDVVCKRVRDITEEEAKEHGCILYNGSTQIQSFSVDYGKRHGLDSWNNNDYVFSASFKILSTTGKPSYL